MQTKPVASEFRIPLKFVSRSCAAGIAMLGIGIVPFSPIDLMLSTPGAGPAVSTASAADRETKVDKYDREVSGPGKIKLNYYSASWARVIQDLTDTFGMEFVGDNMPSGRFSRNDHAEHTRKDAIRIINHEIESQGFRLVEKGRYLILLETTLRRPKAPPAAVTATKKPVPNVDDAAKSGEDRHATADQTRPPATDPQVLDNSASDARQAGNSKVVRSVSFEESVNESSGQKAERLIDLIEHWNESDKPQVQLIQLKNVYAEPTAKLLKSAFRISDATNQSSDLKAKVIVVEMSGSNSLMILAPGTDLAAIIDLARSIDVPIDPRAEFQIFRWPAANAMSVESLIAELSQQRKSIAARSLFIACPRSNSMIVRASPQDLDEIQSWINKKSAAMSH